MDTTAPGQGGCKGSRCPAPALSPCPAVPVQPSGAPGTISEAEPVPRQRHPTPATAQRPHHRPRSPGSATDRAGGKWPVRRRRRRVSCPIDRFDAPPAAPSAGTIDAGAGVEGGKRGGVGGGGRGRRAAGRGAGGNGTGGVGGRDGGGGAAPAREQRGGCPAASPPGIAPGTRPRQQSRWRRPRVAGARPAASGRPGGVRGCAGCRWAKAAATGIWKVPSRPSPVVPSPPPPSPRRSDPSPRRPPAL